MDFHEPPSFNASKSIARMIATATENPTQRSKREFVPFSQERDHLGRLLSSRTQASNAQRQQPKLKEEASRQRDKKSDNEEKAQLAIDKIFRRTQLLQGSSKEGRKMRIKSASSASFQTPGVGSYETAEIASKMKYSRAREVTFRKEKRSNTIATLVRSNPRVRPRQSIAYQQTRTQSYSGLKEAKPVAVSYQLPELEKYLEMKRLKFTLCDNFSEDHARFKELAQSSLALARRLRNSREFDHY